VAVVCAVSCGPFWTSSLEYPPRELRWKCEATFFDGVHHERHRVSVAWSSPDSLRVGVRGPMRVVAVHVLLVGDSLTVWVPSTRRYFVGRLQDVSSEASACGVHRADELFAVCMGRVPGQLHASPTGIDCSESVVVYEEWGRYRGLTYPREVVFRHEERSVRLSQSGLRIPTRRTSGLELILPRDAKQAYRLSELQEHIR
jgi:hypothetical protein